MTNPKTAVRLGWMMLAMAMMLGLGACISPKPVVQYDKPFKVALAQVVDPSINESETSAAPELFSETIEEALSARRLTPEPVPFEAMGQRFAQVRDTKRRVKLVSEVAPDHDLMVLVELRASFYANVVGTWRWTVYAKLTVGEAGRPDELLTRDLELPAALYYAHEGQKEALNMVSGAIAAEVGSLVDDYLRGHQGELGGDKAPASKVEPTPAPVTAAIKSGPRHDDSVYFVMVDRFHNGDPSNDGDDVAKGDPAGWHGGDLQGVLDKIDHLHDLGVRTIWLSPVFKARSKNFMTHGAFHGYWVEDIHAIDPRFGDEATLTALVEALHARDMKLLLDMVVNHVGYEAPLLAEHPDWFHTEGSIEDWNNPVQLVRREVHGLPDLAQENPAVYDHLFKSARHWIETHKIDGYRLDAVKHVSVDFWGKYNGQIAGLGDDLMLLGEMYDGSVKVVDDVQRQGRFTHMFDFPLAFALRDVFCKDRSAGRIASVLSNDRLYTDPNTLVTFLDNHDVARIRAECGEDVGKVRQALTALMAMRGTPSLMYGTESGMTGAKEPENRGDMVFSPQGADDLRGHIKALLGLRRDHKALVEGQSRILRFADDQLVMARVHGDDAALLFVHTGEGRQVIGLPAGLKEVTDAMTGAKVEGGVALEPGQSRLLLAPGGAAALGSTPTGTRRLKITVEGANLQEGQSLIMVGSGPEIGAWDPAKGFGAFKAGDGGRMQAELELPQGLVMAFKLVVLEEGGKARWEQGQDRYIFIEPQPEQGAPLELALTLRPS